MKKIGYWLIFVKTGDEFILVKILVIPIFIIFKKAFPSPPLDINIISFLSLSFLNIFNSMKDVSLCTLLLLYLVSPFCILINSIVPSWYPHINSFKSSVISKQLISEFLQFLGYIAFMKFCFWIEKVNMLSFFV